MIFFTYGCQVVANWLKITEKPSSKMQPQNIQQLF
jgi:hypothetical protein